MAKNDEPMAWNFVFIESVSCRYPQNELSSGASPDRAGVFEGETVTARWQLLTRLEQHPASSSCNQSSGLPEGVKRELSEQTRRSVCPPLGDSSIVLTSISSPSSSCPDRAATFGKNWPMIMISRELAFHVGVVVGSLGPTSAGPTEVHPGYHGTKINPD